MLSLVGNWLLKNNRVRPRTELAKLDQLLRGLDLRVDFEGPQSVFQRVLTRIESLFSWKSAEVEVQAGPGGLLCRRVRQNDSFVVAARLEAAPDRDLFYRLFPPQVDQGSRKPETWVWMMGRIRDGKGVKPPRNLIDLVSMAKDAQLRREEREPRDLNSGESLLEPDSLRRALTQLSQQRVNDTLLAEARQAAPLIERFRRGKAEHTEASLAQLLRVRRERVRETVEPLVSLGFLEEVGSNYKIPMLYRAGLEITQGKDSAEE